LVLFILLTAFATSSIQYSDGVELTDLTGNLRILKGQALYTTSSANVWYAIITHLDSDFRLIEQSSVIAFSVGSTNGEYVALQTAVNNASSALLLARDRVEADCSSASSTISQVWNTAGTAQGLSCVFQRSIEFGLRLFLFPHDFSKTIIANQYWSFKRVFPFSIFFKLSDGVSGAVSDQSLGTAKSWTFTFEEPVYIGVGGGITPSSTTLIVMSDENTLTGILGFTVVDLLFNGLLTILTISLMFILYKLMFHKNQ